MIKRCIILTVLFLFSLPVSAQAEMPFTLEGDGETPVIEHVSAIENLANYPYIEQYTDPGAVIYHEGQFHMFRNGFTGWPAPVWIHYMVSEDGIAWEQASNEPILLSDDVVYADVAILASSVIVEADGTWVLYFYTWNSLSGNFSNGAIGRATAENPAGPWTVDDEPVFLPGESGSFSERGVSSPFVLQTEDGYRMYFDGYNSRGIRSIGLAYSEDGITWETDADNPIMTAEQDWEGNTVHQARLIELDEGYLMIYRSATGGRGGMRLGYASSNDGIAWERVDSPILAPDELENHQAFYFTAVARVDSTVYLFIELFPVANVTDIYTMTAPLDALIQD